MKSKNAHYDIDFVYTENGQQFSTSAMLTEAERVDLEAYLQSLKDAGSISDPQVYERVVVKQSYASAMKEIKAALES